MIMIETFVEEETSELIHDIDAQNEWSEYVAEMGLKGQEKIKKPEKSPIPFKYMNDTMVQMFHTLCPRRVDIENYDATPIPLEIMKLASMSRKEDYFGKIEIWYDEKTPDPVCVGITGYWMEYDWYANSNKELKDRKFKSKKEVEDALGNHPHCVETAKYLIGKWGDVKRSFEELRKMAKERFIGEEKNTCEKQIMEAKHKLEKLHIEANEKFGV